MVARHVAVNRGCQSWLSIGCTVTLRQFIPRSMALDLAYRASGEGRDTAAHPPIVILHGLFGSARNWTSVAKDLAQTWDVYAVDLRNHGESPWSAQMDYPAMAGDIIRFLDSQGLDRAHVIGHSMGGKTAMVAALTHPNRLASLTVVDIAPIPYESGMSAFVTAMQSVPLADVKRRANVEAQLAPVVPDPGVRAFLTQNLVTKDGALHWRLNLDALADQMTSINGFPEAVLDRSYDGPTLFLAGGASDYVRAGQHALIHRLFPKSQIEIVAGAGHWVHAEDKQSFLSHVQAFLNRA